MDIEFVRTFLKVVDTGTFVGAAESLYITQAAVSRRIQSLENYLGCELFTRNKSGAVLTSSGRRFLRYASTLVQTLESARHDVGITTVFQGSLTLGGRFGLWNGLLLNWMDTLHKQIADIQIKALIGFEENLMHDLVDGRLDIGIMYTPQNRPMLKVERLLEEDLILVSTVDSGNQLPDPNAYVHVDWGPEFLAQLSSNLPAFSNPRIIVSIAWLGLQHILANGGSGYFPRRLVREFFNQKRLFPVESAPSFKLPAYVVYPDEPKNPYILPAIKTLYAIAEGGRG